jgi:hypothetical protein
MPRKTNCPDSETFINLSKYVARKQASSDRSRAQIQPPSELLIRWCMFTQFRMWCLPMFFIVCTSSPEHTNSETLILLLSGSISLGLGLVGCCRSRKRLGYRFTKYRQTYDTCHACAVSSLYYVAVLCAQFVRFMDLGFVGNLIHGNRLPFTCCDPDSLLINFYSRPYLIAK